MWTVFIVGIICLIWWGSQKRYMQSGRWADRRKRAASSWAIVGALIGSFFGVAGLGGAIAGTIPGALVGYLLASNLMKRDYDDDTHRSSFSSPTTALDQSPARPTYVQALPTIENRPAPKEKNDDWIWGILFIAFLGWKFGPEILHRNTVSASTPVSPPQIQAAPDPNATLFAQNPGLDPASPHYNTDYAERVQAKLEQHMKAGKIREDALRLAVAEVSATPDTVKKRAGEAASRKHVRKIPETPHRRPCVYKGVMTDDDYRACGIKPPGS